MGQTSTDDGDAVLRIWKWAFGHQEQDRAISLREAAIFQTYPEDYVFCDENKPLSYASVGRMIGNSVPVRLGGVIGESIQKHVKAMV